MILAILVGMAAGVGIVVSRNVNSILAEKIGLWPGTIYNYITGTLLSVVFLFISSESIRQYLSVYKQVPFWAYLGGLAGVVVVVLSNVVTPKISAFYLTLIIFVGQLFTGILIDYFVSDVLSIGKLVGGLLVLAGLLFNMLVDGKTAVE